MMQHINGIDYLSYSAGSVHHKTALVVLHGYGVNCYNLYRLIDQIKADVDWYFPNGLFPVTPEEPEARSWFPIEAALMQAMMASRDQANYAALEPPGFTATLTRLQAFLDHISQSHSQIILAGFSQGAMALPHLAARSKQVAGFMLLSTNLMNLPQLKTDIKNLEAAPLPFLQVHGTHDEVLILAQAQKDFTSLTDLGYSGEFVTFTGAHEIPSEVCDRAGDFINHKILKED